MPEYVVQQIALALNKHGKSISGSRILILGLAYKPDVDDVRESPSIELIDKLDELGALVDSHRLRVEIARIFPLDNGRAAFESAGRPGRRAGKTVIVLDKSNKKLWQAALTYNVSTGDGGRESQFGAGPCVEHGDTLYVFDQAVLGAFDLTTGNARWRLPSVGVVGLFFDGQNNLYVNTTTGNPDDIKYSRQIDVTQSTAAVLLKIEPATGKILWRATPGGFVSYLSGKFIYAVQSYDPNPTDQEVLNDSLVDLQKKPYLRIVRIDPQNGRVLWDHEQDRCPVALQFDQNSIELIFKREVQVLKYLTL